MVPKMAAFDREGWQAHPYIGREFYAEWGDFDVKIKIDKDMCLEGLVIQNPNEVGYGYEESSEKLKNNLIQPILGILKRKMFMILLGQLIKISLIRNYKYLMVLCYTFYSRKRWIKNTLTTGIN